MKIKSNFKNKIANISLKILIIVFFVSLLSTQYVFAENNYFIIQIPKDYQYAYNDEGDTKLIAAREDGKLNFNIQVSETGEYYDYSQKGLSDLIRTTKKDTAKYEVSNVSGKIGAINEYPCYDIDYKLTSTENENEMYIRQIYVYEDKYSYTITIGGESKEIVKEGEIKETMDSFTIEHYKRENVLVPEKEKMSTSMIVILLIAVVIFITLIIVIVVKNIKQNKKQNKKEKGQENKKEKNIKEKEKIIEPKE